MPSACGRIPMSSLCITTFRKCQVSWNKEQGSPLSPCSIPRFTGLPVHLFTLAPLLVPTCFWRQVFFLVKPQKGNQKRQDQGTRKEADETE